MDKRNIPQWYAFWLGFIIALETFAFGAANVSRQGCCLKIPTVSTRNIE